jgi:hypothetical protein
MPKLYLIEAEARRLERKLPESKRRVLREALIQLCQAHWHDIRGPEPATPLSRALWSVPPPVAELFVDLQAAGDARLAALLGGLKPLQALALLVLAEIERGDAEGVHIAHEAMMTFESPAAAQVYTERVALAVRGGLEGPHLHRHSAQPPIWRAIAIIVSRTRRHDLGALLGVIRLLAPTPPGAEAQPDETLERLREALAETGVRFLGVDGSVRFEQHGREHKPVTRKRLGDLLSEIRQARLA